MGIVSLNMGARGAPGHLNLAAQVYPPRSAAPPQYAPVETSIGQGALSPWPLNDRYPIVIGQGLNLSYLSSVFRLATSGYRQQYVDLLNELLENDPHLYSVVSKRIMSTAVARLDVTAFDLPEDHPRYQAAKDVAEMVQRELARIPDLTQVLSSLLWSIYYGIAASEIYWSRDKDGWHIDRLQFVHTRRLSYPDYQSWDLYIWDQGQVYGWTTPWGSSAVPTTNAPYGMRVADWPGKYVVHAPQLRGEYPTRDGLGRQVAVWSVLKRIGARNASEYLERFSKGFMDVTYATGDDGKPRMAEDPDIALAKQIAAQIGPGSGSSAVHGDNVKLEPKGYEGAGTPKVTYREWIDLCDAQESKAVLGGTINTDHRGGGGLGGKGVADGQERGEVSLEQYDASCLADTIRRDLIWWLVKLNMPEALDVVPNAALHVDADPDPAALMEVATALTKIGAPVDLDALAKSVGIALVPNEGSKGEKPKPRRSFNSDVADPMAVDPTLESEESKQAKQDALDTQNELAMQKAKQPVVAGPGGKVPPGSDMTKGKPVAAAGAKGGKKAPKGKAAAGKSAAKKSKGVKQLTDRVSLDLEAQTEQLHRRLLSDRADGAVAQAVYDMLLEDYPASSLGWVLAAQWRGPMLVPTDGVDFSGQERWRAFRELQEDPTALDGYIRRIQGTTPKPVVMVQCPSNPLLEIVDGHHRTMAAKISGMPVLAFIAEVQVDDGPWVTLHGLQTKGSSKTSGSIGGSHVEPSSYTRDDEIDDNA